MTSLALVESTPQPVQARMTADELTAAQTPKLGLAFVAARRKLEVLRGDAEFHRRVGSYFPREALTFLDAFVRDHYNARPETGAHGISTISQRVKRHYPRLFANLRCRISALLELRQFATYRLAFERLEGAYAQDLAAITHLTRNLKGARRAAQRHEACRLAFSSIFDELNTLLLEFVEVGAMMQWRGGA